MKDLGGHVLRRGAIPNPPRDEGVHAIEVELVELAEPRGIRLRGLDERPFLASRLRIRQPRLGQSITLTYELREGRKVTEEFRGWPRAGAAANPAADLR